MEIHLTWQQAKISTEPKSGVVHVQFSDSIYVVYSAVDARYQIHE
jgi:hypothetical protein